MYTPEQAVQIGSSSPRQILSKSYVSLNLVCSDRAHLGGYRESVMHEHITIFWTIVLGIIGSILGGAVTHMFSRPANARYHPAGIIFSTLGAILVLFICYKLRIHFPRIDLIER